MTGIPGATWRMLARRPVSPPLPRGLDAAWDSCAAVAARMVPRKRRLMERAGGVLAMEKTFSQMSDAHLRASCQELRDVFRLGRDAPADLDRAFAVIREVASRQLGQKPFLEQVAGAIGLASECIVEMATGEGKTLTATMPATVAGWRGRGCHVITVNDYLAKRDAENMRSVYSFCGLSAAHVEQSMPPGDRREAYRADITYATNKEATADFLRDRLALGSMKGLSSAILSRIVDGTGRGTDRLMQRGLACAIVDEADSVLIDEAVTPLIISGAAPNAEQVDAFVHAAELGGQLDEGLHYRVDGRYREIRLTAAGRRRVEELTSGLGGVWAGQRRSEELIVQALTARHFYLRDKQYVVSEGKVVIVDEFTGRLMPDREWRDGLHQAVHAREGLEVQPPKETYARLSFQRFFRMYQRLSGMTGTAAEGWREFWLIYHRPVAVIPTHRPCQRRYMPDSVYISEADKWRAVVDEIIEVRQHGRCVLVGTRSVKASEHLSGLLAAKGLEHEVLNAVRHAEEARIVAQAGQEGRITVATNMAGRGTDIKLGRGVADRGGLHVIATERHEARRIDRQLFGRCSRQGDPGSVHAIVSLDDELPQRHARRTAGMLRHMHARSVGDIAGPITRAVFKVAQNHAERLALRQREGVLRTDNWLDEHLGFAGRET